MAETYYAGAYWLARQESSDACARRAETFFRLIGGCVLDWNRWHETANSFEKARKLQLSTDAATLEKFIERKRNRIGDGFHYWLWAGESPEETTAVSGSCGSSTHWVPSVCVLKPSLQGPSAERILTASVMTEVLRAMALAWEPEWGIATSDAHRDSVSPDATVGTFVGWVMYFSRERGPVPPLPAPVRVEPVEDKGTLVLLTPERFTASNPEHVALAARVHELLDGAGLLRPLRPWGAS
jgi:hypothetical protein